MTTRRIEINFDDGNALKAEFEANLVCGGAFSANTTDMEPGDICEIALNHPETGGTYKISARVVSVVSVGPQKGSAFAFLNFGPAGKSDIEAFVNCEHSPDPPEKTSAQNVFERIKNLPMAQLQKMAREGSTSERVALERKFGNVVWADLLKHPRITLPEIARIARKGALSLPLLDKIVNNAAWLQAPQVKRSLLASRRMSNEQARRILKTLPRSDLLLVPSQVTYPSFIREAAKKLIHK